MSADNRLAAVLATAAAEGLLPDASLPSDDDRPWPVVVMTAIGAWFAAVPLCILVALLFAGLLEVAPMTYLCGAAVLGASIAVLRNRELPLFVEQLAIPGLLVGGGLLAFSFFRDLPVAPAAFGIAMLALGTAAAVPIGWLRMLLGMLAALWSGFGVMMLRGEYRWAFDVTIAWWAAHALLAVWVVTVAAQRGSAPRVALFVESVSAGWLVVVLGALAWLTGMTFLGAGLGDAAPTAMSQGVGSPEMRAVSVLLAAGACAWLPLRWPGLRRPMLLAVVAVALPLAWMMPSFGGVLLGTAICTTTARWRQAAFGVVAAVWIVGAFYYQLAWTLAFKAQLMVAAGALLGAAAWSLRAAPDAAVDAVAAESPSARWRLPAVAVLVSVVLTLVVANVGIWQKQDLIANGRPILVKLVPVDPRSLMQGDYMALNFGLATEGAEGIDDASGPGAAPSLVLAVDERGVATPVRIEPAVLASASSLPPGHVRVALNRKSGRWILVTDAWHFAEGQGARFAVAQYGEFRVLPNGRALLVGLRDAQLAPLLP